MKSKVLSFDEITAGIDKVISNTEVLVEESLRMHKSCMGITV